MSKEIQKSLSEPRHPGTTTAEDDELTRWLNNLWARNEPPQRIEVWQLIGKRAMRGEMIFHRNFALDAKLDGEQANQLANEIYHDAQNDCDSAEQKMSYQIAVIDTTKKASPLTRRLGPLEPQRGYSGSGKNNTDDEDENATPQGLNLRMIHEGLEHQRWQISNSYKVFGEMLLLQDGIIRNQQVTIDKMMNKVVDIFDRFQDSKDRELDREAVRNREAVKVRMMEGGLNMAYNMLPSLLAKKDNAPSLTAAVPAQPATTAMTGPQSNYGASSERQVVDNILEEIFREKIDIKLFGQYIEKEDKYLLMTPGIFSEKQFATLYGVKCGDLPPSALDGFLPGSGHELEITEKQMVEAQKAGLTMSMIVGLQTLMKLRQEAIAAQQAQAQAQPQTQQEAR